MGLLGDGFDDPQSQMMMGLAQGLLSTRGGAGLAAGLGNMQAVRQQGLQNRLINAQLANYDSEIQARKLATIRDNRQQEALYGDSFGAGGGASNSDAVTSPGAFVPSLNGMGPTMPAEMQQPQRQGGGLVAAARAAGLPDAVIRAEIGFNGGKKLAEMINERAKPNWQNINGNLVNTNAQGFTGGLQGGMSASADGKMLVYQPDGKGGLVAGAPAGALDTYRAYQGAQADYKPIKVYNPATGREEYTSEGAVVGGQPAQPRGPASAPGYANEPQMRATAGGDMGADPAALQREIKAVQNDLMRPLDTGSRTQMQGYLADLQRQAANLPVARLGPASQAQSPTTAGGNYAAGPSQSEAALAEANKAKLVGTANADVVRDTSKQQAGKLYGQLTAGLDRAIDLLGQGPTASGAGALVDSAANFIGRSTKGADTASQLDTISGWLTSNVPRMEGPQSDKDVQNYRIMAAEVGDRTKPVSQRLAAAKELQALQAKYATLNGGQNTGGATGSFDDKPASTANKTPPPVPMKGMVRGGYKFKGGDPSNQANWEAQ